MDELVMRIKDPDLCYVFVRNAHRQGRPELALQAYRRAVDLRAEQHETSCEAELGAYRAIYAYEEALSLRKGKRTRATGTWQMVNRHGVLATIEKRLRARDADDLLPALQELGMENYSFRAVREQFPGAFTEAAA